VGPVAVLASFLAETDLGELPPAAIDHAKMALASTLASAAAGVEQRSTRIARDLAAQRGGVAEATVWFDGGTRLPVTEAARINAMRSDAAACDDADFRTMAHIGTTVASVALAVGERAGCSGREVLGAMVCGYEACGRLGEATAPQLGERGFHPALLGGFGAAACAAKLMQLPARQWLDAFSLAAATAAGLLAGSDGWTREYQAGAAVASGLNATLSAAHGYGAPEQLIDGPRGFLATVAGEADMEALTGGLGLEWDIASELGIKMRPGGYPFAAAVEAAIEAARNGGIHAEDVARVTVSGPSFHDMIGTRHPRDFVEAIHSLAYYIAAGIADREFSWRHVSASRLDEPRMVGLLDLIEVVPDPGDARFAFRWGATVRITTHAGATFASTVDVPWGAARRGIEWQDVETKVRALMGDAGHAEAAIAALLRDVRGLDGAAGIAALATRL